MLNLRKKKGIEHRKNEINCVMEVAQKEIGKWRGSRNESEMAERLKMSNNGREPRHVY